MEEITNGIDVLETLKSKNITCDLHYFIKSNNNTNDEYNLLINDLTIYCSNSSSTKSYRILCRMILIELEIGCLVLNQARPLPLQYTTSYTASQLCAFKKIPMINYWIWKKLTINERAQIGTSPHDICPKITSLNDAIRLSRFFYRIAARIRRANTVITTTHTTTTLADIIPARLQLIQNLNINELNSTNRNQTTQVQSIIVNTNETFDSSENDSTPIMVNTTQLLLNSTQNNSTINSVLSLNGTTKKQIEAGKKSDEGSPLARGVETPEREQINERPKPKPIDVEAVFKESRHDVQWIEGNNSDSNRNNIRRLRVDENSNNNELQTRRKISFRPRIGRYYSNINDRWSNHFVTSSLIFCLCVIVTYLALYNKNKILGLLVEGCRRIRRVHPQHRRNSPPPRRTVRLSQSK